MEPYIVPVFPLPEESEAIAPLPSLKFQKAARLTEVGTAAVTTAVAVPLTVPFDAVIVVVPGVDAVNKPPWVIVPTVMLLLDHDIETAMGLPDWS